MWVSRAGALIRRALPGSCADRVAPATLSAHGLRHHGHVSDQPEAATATATRVWLLAAIAALVLVADIITKTIAVAQLEGREPVQILGGLIYLQLLRNPGAAFSMATGFTWILTVIAIGVVFVIVRVARKLRSTGWAVALGLVLGGALGNLTDRIFREPGPLQGHVVDMVSPFAPNGEAFAVFNLADAGISCGGVLLVVLALLGIELDGRRAHKEPAGE
jgi:signal peptidase II